MIAVAGGTGRLGTEVVRRLAARGLEVRVLTRDPSRARHLEGLVTDVVTTDVRDRVEIRSALQGATTVVSAVQGFAGPGHVSPASVDRDGNINLIDAAAAVNADVVLMSVVGASSDHQMELFRAKHAAEQHLRGSGVGWTVVRATAFAELWAELMQKGIVFGQGENPINFVSVTDVAAAVERAVIDPDLRQRVINVGGPENLTFNEFVDLLQGASGDRRKLRHIPRPVLRAMGPLNRQVRAAVAMDTIDLTFNAAANLGYDGQAMTDLRTALATATVPRVGPSE